MYKIRLFLLGALLTGSVSAHAGNFGINLGTGVPYLTQVGLDYKVSPMIGFSFGYNLLSLSLGEASLDLSMPELLVNYHPFSGSFFISAGVGQETLEVTSVESFGTNTVKIEVSAMTAIVKTGWRWGYADGFWFGIDYSFISPSGGEPTITAPGVPTTDPSYIDAVDAAQKFGETAYGNITLARFGWLF